MRRLILLSLLLSVPLLARAVRPAFGAGLWYPGEREELSREVDRLIGNPSQKRIFPRLLLVPHAGYRYSGVVAGRGYAQIRGRAFSRVLILGPSHRGGAEGLILPREEAFKIPDLIRTKINLLPAHIKEVRTVEIVGLDLQADGGTHVKNTNEVGAIHVVDYKSKGKINKRIYIELEE